jgi:hypothetical protein
VVAMSPSMTIVMQVVFPTGRLLGRDFKDNFSIILAWQGVIRDKLK